MDVFANSITRPGCIPVVHAGSGEQYCRIRTAAACSGAHCGGHHSVPPPELVLPRFLVSASCPMLSIN
jgi:hypothetical protein